MIFLDHNFYIDMFQGKLPTISGTNLRGCSVYLEKYILTCRSLTNYTKIPEGKVNALSGIRPSLIPVTILIMSEN